MDNGLVYGVELDLWLAHVSAKRGSVPLRDEFGVRRWFRSEPCHAPGIVLMLESFGRLLSTSQLVLLEFVAEKTGEASS